MTERWIDFGALKSKVPIRDVLARYGHLNRLKEGRNGRLTGPCPIHGGKSPTAFNVDTEKGIFNCFSECGGGNVIDLVMKLEGCDVRAAGEKLCSWFNLSFERKKAGTEKSASVSQKTTPKAAVPEHQPEHQEEGGNAPLERGLQNLNQDHPYLFERGLTVETIKTFGLGYCTRGIMRGRIAIPIHDAAGKLVAYAGRALSEEQVEAEGKYKLPRGFEKSRELYNLNRSRESAASGLIVVEGFFDAMHVSQAGFRNVVALMGSTLSEHQEHLLSGATDRLVLMFDGDESGEKCVREFYRRLRRRLYLKEIHLEEGQQPDGLSDERLKELLG